MLSVVMLKSFNLSVPIKTIVLKLIMLSIVALLRAYKLECLSLASLHAWHCLLFVSWLETTWKGSTRQVFPSGVNFTNILWAVFAPKSFHKKLQTQIVSTSKLCKKLSYEKAAPKKLVKLTPGRLRLQTANCKSLVYSQEFESTFTFCPL